MSSKTRQTVHLWPVDGRSVPGVPMVEQDAAPEDAARLVASGGFTDEPPAEQPATED